MLGTRIAALRRQANMSQAELAARLQVSPSAIGMYEQGRREPSAQMLVALARTFGVTTDYLLTGTPSSRQDSEILAQVLLRSLNTADGQAEQRKERPLSRRELAVLVAAMLTEP